MSSDWFVDTNSRYLLNLQKIADLDKKIKGEVNKDERDNLKTERQGLWNGTWEKVCKAISYHSSQIEMLTSLYFEQESLKDILRARHIEISYKNGKQVIKNSLKYAQLDTFFEDFRIPKRPNLAIYPLYSFFIQFSFTLATPYVSKDDEEFYICENPVRKDKVFKVPMVSGSSWKGNLRWTAGKMLELKTDTNRRLSMRVQIAKLFGHENESEKRYFDSLMPGKKDDFKKEMIHWTNQDGLRSGRLQFYPTFFDQISLEVINPHDRKTKAGTIPVYIESVPEKAEGTFGLLYVPFDLMGRPAVIARGEVKSDLKLVCRAIYEMMFTYGFSAKKSSGFGVANPDCVLKDEWFDGNGVEIANANKDKFTKLSDFRKVECDYFKFTR